MGYSVRITASAKQDIADTMQFIELSSTSRARKWLSGLLVAMDSLQEMPVRHALMAEASQLRPLRALLYHSHRVIYEIDETAHTVAIVRVYHMARKPLDDQGLR